VLRYKSVIDLKIKTKIEPSCAYCLNGKHSPVEGEILCKKTGVRDPSSYCDKFAYDPLKRQPKRPPPLPRFDEGDFAL